MADYEYEPVAESNLSDKQKSIRKSEENPRVEAVYEEIIKEEGEESFRNKESEIIKEISNLILLRWLIIKPSTDTESFPQKI